ncbi:TPA: hypothetical protein ACK3Q6_003193 [Burkholderia cepacia]|nr:hypothetical protein [Burkholderia cepacia]HDR9759518.1 hypothetical protein [Burkholderia cepacia ATCC 25416]
MTTSQIAQLAAHAQAGRVSRLLIEAPGCHVQLEFHVDTISEPEPRAAALMPAAAEAATATKATSVRTTGFGVFLSAYPLAAVPFAQPGDAVSDGDVVGLLRSGLIYRAVRAPCAGTLDAVLVEPGTLTGHGQEVLRLQTPEDTHD